MLSLNCIKEPVQCVGVGLYGAAPEKEASRDTDVCTL